MLTSTASVPTVCASLCQAIHLAYDGTSFLQVVLCYQLHSPLPARKMLFVPGRTYTHTHTHTSERTRRGRRGTDTCRVFVTSSAGICDRTALWERRPSVVGKAGLEGGKRARCIMLLFSVGLSCVKCCVVKVFLLFSSYRRYSAKIIQQQEDGKLNSAIDKLQMQLRSCCNSVKSNCSFSWGQ